MPRRRHFSAIACLRPVRLAPGRSHRETARKAAKGNTMDLAGNAVIVTGSSSGIGAAIARRVSGLGAGVVVNSKSSVDAGKRLADDLPDAIYVPGDIGDPATATALVSAAEGRWGRLDGLVNNAGVTVDVPLHDIDAVTIEHWNTVLRTNVVGTFLVSQAALPLLRRADDGWIVNVTSLAGVRQTGSSLPYAVSKAALNHLTAIMAKHAGSGVRVNAVAPGLVATPWTADWDERKAGVELIAPLHRVATADDVASACLALVPAPHATGQALVVDGGLGLTLRSGPMRITVRVRPGSARRGVGGEHDGAVVVRVRARAVDGQATAAALAAIAA